MPELDISAAADEVVQLLQQGQPREAADRLQALREGEATVVQEALDRYVAQRGAAQLDALRQPGAVPAGDAAAVTPMLERLDRATGAPRLPGADETAGLSQAQQYDVYASIVATRGDQAARDALGGQDRVILGLRDESRTTENRGRGEYDDRIVVVWRDADGSRHAREFNQVTTEPTAQYDGHAKTSPRSPGFGNVITRPKTEGEDVDGDRVRDLGRLAEGTTEMRATTHPRHGHADEWALRPTADAVANGASRVERDTNGDGWFDSRDVNGVQALNDTFKIHRGSRANTDSAGCQTIGGNEYDAFVRTVRGTPGQDRWQYVLTGTAPGVAPERAQDPAREQAGSAAPGLAGNADPRQPGHPDHAMYGQIQAQLRELGGDYERHAGRYALALLHRAKEAGLTGVDDIALSNATAGRAAGETIFLVQGRTGDPAAHRVAAVGEDIRQASEAQSLERLQAQERAREPANAPPVIPPHARPAQEAPALRH